MSFWSDASGATKGILVVGVILIIVLGIYAVLPDGERASTRGVEGGAATTATE